MITEIGPGLPHSERDLAVERVQQIARPLGALLQGEAITDAPAAPYRTVVSRAIAGRFRVEPVSYAERSQTLIETA
jgi:hypothetical protein